LAQFLTAPNEDAFAILDEVESGAQSRAAVRRTSAWGPPPPPTAGRGADSTGATDGVAPATVRDATRAFFAAAHGGYTAPGTLGGFVADEASAMEKANAARLVALLTAFEEGLGLAPSTSLEERMRSVLSASLGAAAAGAGATARWGYGGPGATLLDDDGEGTSRALAVRGSASVSLARPSAGPGADGALTIPLGSRLRASVRFFC
jgi:hypothetical protein